MLKKMLKMTESKARQYVEQEMGGDWEDRSEYVRYCCECGSWVDVDDYSGNLDKCDDC